MTPTETSPILLRGARLVLPDRVIEEGTIITSDGRIERVSEVAQHTNRFVRTIDLDGATIFPGFIDVHIHGGIGIDVNEADADELHNMARFLAANGVTGWLPTLVPAPDDHYARTATAVANLMRDHDSRPAAARALGLHYEGPFVNTQQCGALRTQYFRVYRDASDLQGIARVDYDGARHMITLAPEIEGGPELISQLTSREWVVSIGHTRADIETLESAVNAGASHMTHFPNAMPQLHHRSPGPVGWGLLRDDVSVDIIADGVHADRRMLELVMRCKTTSSVSLISDSVAPTGMGDGDFRVWDEKINVTNGRTSNERGCIAGSVITMRDAVSFISAMGVKEVDVARMASLNPARLLRLDHECGSLEAGKRADLTAIDTNGKVLLTIVGGRLAYEN